MLSESQDYLWWTRLNLAEPTSPSQVAGKKSIPQICFHVSTLGQYAECVDSLRQPECCVENSDLVSAAIEGNLQKVIAKLPSSVPNISIDILLTSTDTLLTSTVAINHQQPVLLSMG